MGGGWRDCQLRVSHSCRLQNLLFFLHLSQNRCPDPLHTRLTQTKMVRQAQVAYNEAAKSWENLADAAIWWETAVVRVRFGDFDGAAKSLAKIIRDFPGFESINQVVFMSASVLQ